MPSPSTRSIALLLLAPLLWLGIGTTSLAAELQVEAELWQDGTPAEADYELRVRVDRGQPWLTQALSLGVRRVQQGRLQAPLSIDDRLLAEARGFQLEARPAGSTDAFTLLAEVDAKATCALSPWTLTGNGDATSGSFLGTINGEPLRLRSQNRAVGYLSSFQTGVAPDDSEGVNVVLGWSGNQPGHYGNVVLGGGRSLGDARPNVVAEGQTFATISGGLGNTANGGRASIGGGRANRASSDATVAGGYSNYADGIGSRIGGGLVNWTKADYSGVGGGYGNTAGAQYVHIGGGFENFADAGYGTIGGGSGNQARGSFNVIAGGDHNETGASWSSIAGGRGNRALGNFSFAIGDHAGAQHNSSLVWSQSDTNAMSSSADNQVVFGARGGFGINGSTGPIPGTPLNAELTLRTSGLPDNNVDLMLLNHTSSTSNFRGYSLASVPNGQFFITSLYNNGGSLRYDPLLAMQATNDGNAVVTINRSSFPQIGAVLQVGDSGNDGNGAFLSSGGTWTNASSRIFKTAFTPIDPEQILDRLLSLPLSSWRYRDSAEGRHLGPMAEEFGAAFSLGNDSQRISTVDADGVNMAAIQGLHIRLQRENAALRARLDRLEQHLDRIASETP